MDKARQFKQLNNKNKHFLNVAVLLFVFFIGAASYSQTCPELFKVEPIFSDRIELVYKKLTSKSSWGDNSMSTYFNSKDFFPKELTHGFNKRQIEEAEFAYVKLNDPLSFKNFLYDLLSECKKIDANLNPSRETLLKVINSWLVQEGFTTESAGFLPNNVFHERMTKGIITLESEPSFLQNGHGHDTHLIQLAYISREFNKKFGKGSALEFYKFMGIKYYLWGQIFDSPSTDHLGNPSVLNRNVRSLGFQ
jgi:hypothetical protein